jgi:hypothetical protein
VTWAAEVDTIGLLPYTLVRTATIISKKDMSVVEPTEAKKNHTLASWNGPGVDELTETLASSNRISKDRTSTSTEKVKDTEANIDRQLCLRILDSCCCEDVAEVV